MSAEEPFVTRIPRRRSYTRTRIISSGKKQEATIEKDVCFVCGIYQRKIVSPNIKIRISLISKIDNITYLMTNMNIFSLLNIIDLFLF